MASEPTDKLEAEVARAIDEAIRLHRPGDAGSYAYWDGRLERLQHEVASAESPAERAELLGRVYSHRIFLAHLDGRPELVLELSAAFLIEVRRDHADAVPVMAQRAEALHRLDAHDQEIRELHAFLKMCPDLGSGLLALVADAARRHPGTLRSLVPHLADRVSSIVHALRAQGYLSLEPPSGKADAFEEEVIQLDEELRRVNRERTAEFLRSIRSPEDRE